MDQARRHALEVLDGKHISYRLTEHEAVNTIEEMDRLKIDEEGSVLKNLFICDEKKKRFFLVSMCKEKKADLKHLRLLLDSKPLKFAKEEDLSRLLGLIKGEVTPLGIINDLEHLVEVVLDEDIFRFSCVGVHPNDNTATVWLSPHDLKSLIQDQGNPITVVRL